MFNCSTLSRVVFWTSKSRRTTTPNIIKKNTPHINIAFPIQKRSHNYDLSGSHVVNRNLYWNQTENNKKTRTAYLDRKAREFGIRAMVGHPQSVRRSQFEIIQELLNKQLIQKDWDRTIRNLLEYMRLYQKGVANNIDVLSWAAKQLEKQILLVNWSQFATFCSIYRKLQLLPTENMQIALYQHLYSAAALPKPIPILSMSKALGYLFKESLSDRVNNVLSKNPTPYQLFQDNDPRPQSIQQLLDRLYPREALEQFVSGASKEEISKVVTNLERIPGTLRDVLISI